MPHYKCVACRTRTRRVGDASDFTGDLCPTCGSPHELVSELSEVVGFRSVATTDLPRAHPARMGDFTSHRNAVYAQRVRDALDADHWTDDGEYAVAAVALPTSDRCLLPNAGAHGEKGTT